MALIELNNVNLEYYIYGTSSRSLKNTLIKAATGGILKKEEKILKVEALKELTFQLKDGDRLGLIGHNGAGKSSLLRLLAQIYEPTSGKIEVVGHTNCLFDIMVGLDASLSGYDNIKLRGVISGLSTKQIHLAIPEIASFAELGDFIRMPLRTYSAGMLLRLGFSIVTHFTTEILLIDEVVSVGDAIFISKAKARMKDLINQTKIVVISTHDHGLIQEFCNRILCLEHGRIKFLGSSEEYFQQKKGNL